MGMKNNKIPKIIHYCWFGRGYMNDMILSCIDSWKKVLTDYEFILWNEDNFDINSNIYTKEAYESGKWAFVTDYVRLWALYNYGGIYLDTDVEILKPLDRFLKHSAFSGFENKYNIPTGIMGSCKGNIWIKYLLDYYKNKRFINDNGEYILVPNTKIITDMSKTKGLILNGKYQTIMDDVHIYPKCYFAPKSYITGNIKLTKDTYCIHHFNGSWLGENNISRSKLFLANIIGDENYIFLVNIKKFLFGENKID